MPELPEVESLAAFLRERAAGRTIARAEAASIAVLKTFDPPLTALTGRVIATAGRHGKFLDLTCAPEAGGPQPGGPQPGGPQPGGPQPGGPQPGGPQPGGPQPGGPDLHLIMHLARAGWLRWRDELPDKPVKPGKSPLAFRLTLDDGSGFELTEAGTRKRLAVYLVRDPAEVPGVASLGPDPLAAEFTVDSLASLLNGRRTQIKGVLRDQHIIG